MKLGYTIIYVADVPAMIVFYEKTFGLKRSFVHDSNLYVEMETGSTTLAFAGEPMAAMNELGYSSEPSRGDVAAGFEIAFVTDDPETAYRKAVDAGARAVELNPWTLWWPGHSFFHYLTTQ